MLRGAWRYYLRRFAKIEQILLGWQSNSMQNEEVNHL